MDFFLKCSTSFYNQPLKAITKQMTNKEKPTYLVLRIFQCAHGFPYHPIFVNRLHIETERSEERSDTNPGRYPFGKHSKEKGEKRKRGTPNKEYPKQTQRYMMDAFPAMESNPLLVREHKITVSGDAFYVEEKEETSSEKAEYSGSNIAPGRKELNVPQEVIPVEKTEKKRRTIPQYFSIIVEAMKEMKKNNDKVRAWNVVEIIDENTKYVHDNMALSVFPTKGDISFSWAIMNRDGDARRCLWVEINYDGKYYYICEWERRDKENFAIYLLNKRKNQKATDIELSKIMYLWASSPEMRKKEGLKENGWIRESVKHLKNGEERANVRIAENITKKL